MRLLSQIIIRVRTGVLFFIWAGKTINCWITWPIDSHITYGKRRITPWVLQRAPSNSFFSSYASGMWTYRSVLLGRCDNIRTKSRLQQQTQRKLCPKLKRRDELITCSFVLPINVSYRSFLKESNYTLMISSSNLLDDVDWQKKLLCSMQHENSYLVFHRKLSVSLEVILLIKIIFHLQPWILNFMTCTEDVYTEMKF